MIASRADREGVIRGEEQEPSHSFELSTPSQPSGTSVPSHSLVCIVSSSDIPRDNLGGVEVLLTLSECDPSLRGDDGGGGEKRGATFTASEGFLFLAIRDNCD